MWYGILSHHSLSSKFQPCSLLPSDKTHQWHSAERGFILKVSHTGSQTDDKSLLALFAGELYWPNHLQKRYCSQVARPVLVGLKSLSSFERATVVKERKEDWEIQRAGDQTRQNEWGKKQRKEQRVRQLIEREISAYKPITNWGASDKVTLG